MVKKPLARPVLLKTNFTYSITSNVQSIYVFGSMRFESMHTQLLKCIALISAQIAGEKQSTLSRCRSRTTCIMQVRKSKFCKLFRLLSNELGMTLAMCEPVTKIKI